MLILKTEQLLRSRITFKTHIIKSTWPDRMSNAVSAYYPNIIVNSLFIRQFLNKKIIITLYQPQITKHIYVFWKKHNIPYTGINVLLLHMNIIIKILLLHYFYLQHNIKICIFLSLATLAQISIVLIKKLERALLIWLTKFAM